MQRQRAARRNKMAIRYVKDFEFPSAAGYTKSATKVTGQMYAKGGKVHKSEGSKQSEFNKSGYDRDALQSMMNDIAAADEAERIMRKPTPTPKTTAPKAKKPEKTSPYIPGTNIKPDAEYMRDMERKQSTPEPSEPAPPSTEENSRTPAKKGGFMKKANGGKVSHMEWEHSKKDLMQDRKLAKKHGMSMEAWEKSSLDKKHDKQQSPKGLKKGGAACYAEGGMAQKVQMAKSNAIEASLKGQKKTPYAKGGPAIDPNAGRAKGLGPVKLEPPRRAPAPVMPERAPPRPAPAMMAPPRPAPAPMAPPRGMAGAPPAPAGVIRRAKGGSAAAPQSPLQRMALSPKSVPVAPRAPVIQAPSTGSKGVAVNAKRPGGPDVGAMRAAMAKAASQAKPENAPSMMKKGGKVK